MDQKTYLGKSFLVSLNSVSGMSVGTALAEPFGKQLDKLVELMLVEASAKAVNGLCIAEATEYLARGEVATKVREYAKVILRYCRREKRAWEGRGFNWLPRPEYWIEESNGKMTCRYYMP